MIGRIQLGALDARYPYVIEPAVPEGVPAAGIPPIEPACVVTPGVVYRGGLVRIERVQPRQGALAATIAMMAPALVAASSS